MNEIFNELENLIFTVWRTAVVLEKKGYWRRAYKIREIVLSPQAHRELIAYFNASYHYAFTRGNDGDPTYRIYGIPCRVGETQHLHSFDVSTQPKYQMNGQPND